MKHDGYTFRHKDSTVQVHNLDPGVFAVNVWENRALGCMQAPLPSTDAPALALAVLDSAGAEETDMPADPSGWTDAEELVALAVWCLRRASQIDVKPAKFRKKPVVIEAMQLDGANREDIFKWASSLTPLGHAVPVVPKSNAIGQMLVHTLEGTMTANPGDWIIRGVQGEFYPCKPDIFEQTYEVATDG